MAGLREPNMYRTESPCASSATAPCPLCGRLTRAHSRIEVADVEGVGRASPTTFNAVICRDCAVALVMRSQASRRYAVPA